MTKEKIILEKTYDHCPGNEPQLTVVLIHGIASDSSTYKNALSYLEGVKSLSAIRFVTFDLLGSGKSLASDDLNYDYNDQLEALHNAIDELNILTPLVLVGHSLGTFIVTKYANTYQDEVSEIILISPPIYTPEDFDNPMFEAGIQAFKNTIATRNAEIVTKKPFNASMEKIVLDKNNYSTLTKTQVPVTIIYGEGDQIIASYNIPRLLKDSTKKITVIKTAGRHGVTEEKFDGLVKSLEKALNDQIV